MSERRSDLARQHDEICVGLAMRGILNETLRPDLWEPLRQQLQRIYRKATGETQATLHVELTPATRPTGEKHD